MSGDFQNRQRMVMVDTEEGLDYMVAGEEGLVGSFTIVGHCPKCGAPIYGREMIGSLENPDIRFACSCRRQGGLQAENKSLPLP